MSSPETITRPLRDATAGTSGSAGFRPDIQGLRAVAVLAVVLNHAGIPAVSGGYVGVDVFFVISGFLITSHLLRSLERDGRIHFANFYARRARRLLPASFTVLALSVIGTLLFVPPLLREQFFRDAIATALYVPNYAFALQGTDYLAPTIPSLFQHYWSLGVEEQFYLVWPLLLLLAFTLARRSRRALTIVLAVVIVASFTCSLLLTAHSQPWAFFSLWTRAWELGMGGLLAVIPLPRRLPAWVSAAIGWMGLAAIVASCVLFSATTVFPGWAALLPVVGAAAVILSGSLGLPDRGSFARGPFARGPVALLGLPPAQFLGLISYSLYLVHWPLLLLIRNSLTDPTSLPVWATTLIAAAAIPLAWLLYRFVEQPGRTASWWRQRDRRSLIGAGVGAGILAGASALALVATVALPLDSGRATASSTPSNPPVVTSFVPTNLAPTLQNAADDNPAIYAEGCEIGVIPTVPKPCISGTAGGPRIVLFGDSHAAQWYPALEKVADEQGYQLETQSKSGCPSIGIEVTRNTVPYLACDKWRKNVIAELRADPPALVVLANYSNPPFTDPSDPSKQWASGMRSTIGQLTDATQVAVFADTPDLRTSPLVCLSAHLTDADACGRPTSVALDSPGREPGMSAANLVGATLIDLTGYFCDDDWCPTIIGNTLVYRDSHHITATFSAELAEVLAPRLEALLS